MSQQPFSADETGALERLMSATAAVMASQDRDLRYRWMCNAPSWLAGTMIGRTDHDLFPDVAEELTQAKRQVIATGMPKDLHLDLGGTDAFDIRIVAEVERGGATVGVLTLMLRSPAQARPQTQEVLLRELTHRSKNLLAIVQSIAAQTAKTTDSTASFLERFNGRLRSLSHSQDLVTNSNWRGARIAELAMSQIDAYADDPAVQVEFKGTDFFLRPNAALYVGLALHELAANASRWGAFSTPAGRVTIESRLIDGAARDQSALQIAWVERGGPPPPPGIDDGFAHALISRLVPASVGGKAHRVLLPDGLRYELTLAAYEFE